MGKGIVGFLKFEAFGYGEGMRMIPWDGLV